MGALSIRENKFYTIYNNKNTVKNWKTESR